VCFSPDGRSLFSAGSGGEIIEWSAESWSQVRAYRGHSKRVNGIVFSPDGKVVVSAANDGEIRWWDRGEEESTEGLCIRKLKESRRRIDSIFATPDGKYLLASTPQEILIVILMADGTTERRVRPFEKRMGALDLSRLGTRIAIGGSGDTVYLYSIPDASLVTSVKTGAGTLTGFVFCRDTHHALSLGGDGILRVWDSADWRETGKLALDGQTTHKLAVSPNGASAVVASGRNLTVIEMEDLSITHTIALPEGSLVWANASESDATLVSSDTATSLAFSPDEKLLAASAPNGQIYVWEL
jgi:WD40 repeat protein